MKSQREERAAQAAAVLPEVFVVLHSVPIKAEPTGNNNYRWMPGDTDAAKQLAGLIHEGWTVLSTVAMQGSGYGSTLIYTLVRATAPQAPTKEPIKCR